MNYEINIWTRRPGGPLIRQAVGTTFANIHSAIVYLNARLSSDDADLTHAVKVEIATEGSH